jgi:hypothetical protein
MEAIRWLIIYRQRIAGMDSKPIPNKISKEVLQGRDNTGGPM